MYDRNPVYDVQYMTVLALFGFFNDSHSSPISHAFGNSGVLQVVESQPDAIPRSIGREERRD